MSEAITGRIIREKVFQIMYLLENRKDVELSQAFEQSIFYQDWDGHLSLEEAMVLQLPDKLRNKEETDEIATEILEKIQATASEIFNQLIDIDQIIASHLDKWSIERLEKTSLYILRIAVFDIYHRELDKSIAINEAVEMAKTFNDDKSAKFINGVLQSVVDEKEANDKQA